jgi:hypothetical protein
MLLAEATNGRPGATVTSSMPGPLMWSIGRRMFESIKTWLVQLAYDWLTEAIQWCLVYGTFILVCFIIAVFVLGLHLVWRSLPGHWFISILGILGLIVRGALAERITNEAEETLTVRAHPLRRSYSDLTGNTV